MANKSADKGKTYEYKVRDIFTDHFKVKFERVPTSGALPYLKGDIWAPEYLKEWPYTVECKHYKELDFNNLLSAKSNPLWSFWEQAITEAKIMNKKPLVVFRWNRSKDYVIFNDNILVPSYFEVKAFNHQVKISFLNHWLDNVNLKLS